MLDLLKEVYKDMWVYLNLDGTIADIGKRRKLCDLGEGKLNWEKFFDSNNIELDEPYTKIITLVTMFKNVGFKIAILSGRSKSTKEATKKWLELHKVPFRYIKDEANISPMEIYGR